MHLSTGILVYSDLISKQAKYLLLISISLNLLKRGPEFLVCVSLMVSKRGLAILWRSGSYARENKF